MTRAAPDVSAILAGHLPGVRVESVAAERARPAYVARGLAALRWVFTS